MGKPVDGEAPPSTHQHHGESHSNQASTSDGSQPPSSSAAASREIFQGLFKDLGKQAMAMESILRIVCGKVDKLEHWLTEMSFGMTELDLKLRNIAHNIEGTAANVDDVASVSRWAVPQEEEETATATVVKKVGVGLNKRKQMRMTGMVANILDQLTTVAETPSVVESETESHDGGSKKKAKSKAKKAAKESAGVATPPSSTSTSNTPRAAEGKEKTSKPHKKKHHKPHEAASEGSAAAEVDADAMVGSAASETTSVEAETKQESRAGEEAAVAESSTPATDAEDVAAEEKEEIRPVGRDETHEPPRDAKGALREAADDVVKDEQKPANGRGDRGEEVTEVDGEQVETLEPDEMKPDTEADLEQKAITPTAGAEQREPQQPPPTIPNDPPEPVVPHVEKAATPRDTEAAGRSDSEPQPITPVAKPPENGATNALVADSPTTTRQEALSASSSVHESARDVDESVGVAAASLVPPAASPAPQPAQTAAGDAVVERKTPTRPPPPVVPVELVRAAPSLVATADDPPPAQQAAIPPLAKAGSNKFRNRPNGASDGATTRPSPTKKSSRKASIRQAVTQRQPSLKKRHLQDQEEPSAAESDHISLISSPSHAVAAVSTQTAPKTTLKGESLATQAAEAKQATSSDKQLARTADVEHDKADDNESDDEDSDDDSDDDDDDDSSQLSSDSDESVLDLGSMGAAKASSSGASAVTSAASKKMSAKITRTMTALNKLQKANVLTPEEIAELKQRANQKWFKLRDHVKEKNKKDVANILLKRKKNIFTVSNRIELLEEKSREVYASIKQLNTDLKGKLDMATFEGLRRHVHDIHTSLQVLDQKITKGNMPTMDHIKQLAKDTETLRLLVLEQIQLARDHCDANHGETLRLFEKEWSCVAAIEKSFEEKLSLLAAEFDGKLHELPNYSDALEGIRRAIRKKADLKVLRELEARLLGHDADSEDCLVRCLSCHKEVVNASHESHTGDDNDSGAVGSPHFKRVNPGTASAKVYRSNVPLNAVPLRITEFAPELFGLYSPDEKEPAGTTPSGTPGKTSTPSRRSIRTEVPKASPLSFIHITATRAMATVGDSSRPISAPASVMKKKPQTKSAQAN